ncbi:uncharacterized protein LOC142179115 [Nicotiana tabacum]|uniref:Uncharacterized protein LOC142179115 n=1 Tax=Nicotiana tabacum TaxID=4097 RepID=A0AC58U6S3_TOBAC
MGSSLFWFGNWTGLGALYFVTPPDFLCDESIHIIYNVVENDQWDEEKIREILPEELADHILLNMKSLLVHDVLDKPQWMLETRGVFSVKSAWEYLRRRNEPANAYKKIWVKGLPFKIAFFMWKMWKNKLPLDDFFRRLGYYYAVDYIPSSSDQVLECRCDPSIASYYVSTTIQSLVKLRKRVLQNVPHKWPDLLSMMESYLPKLKFTKVLWGYPSPGWIKVNTDGASRDNPGLSSIGFVLRNEEGDIVYGCGKEV